MVSSSSHEWWETTLEQLFEGVLVLHGAGALGIEEGEEGLKDLGVLLLAVLLLVGGDGALGAKRRIDLVLLGHGMRDEQLGQGGPSSRAVTVGATALAQ